MDEQDRAEQKPENREQQEGIASAPIETVHSESDKKTPNAEAGNIQEPMTRFERVTIGLAILGTLLAVGTAVIFYDQFGEMAAQTDALNIAARQSRRDSALADIKTQIQLKLAADQTKAAQDSVKAIQRQMRQDQRAWVQISTAHSEPFLVVPDKPLAIALKFVNTGKTSALDIAAEAILEIVPKKEQPRFSYKVPHSIKTTGLLYRDDPFELEATTFEKTAKALPGVSYTPIPLGQTDFSDLSSGRAYYVYFGKVEYRDVFGTKHWTQFCAWSAAVKGLYPSKRCTAYNRADNN